MTATIWEHWFKYYVTYTNESGDTIAQEWFNDIEDAKRSAMRWGAFVIIEG